MDISFFNDLAKRRQVLVKRMGTKLFRVGYKIFSTRFGRPFVFRNATCYGPGWNICPTECRDESDYIKTFNNNTLAILGPEKEIGLHVYLTPHHKDLKFFVPVYAKACDLICCDGFIAAFTRLYIRESDWKKAGMADKKWDTRQIYHPPNFWRMCGRLNLN